MRPDDHKKKKNDMYKKKHGIKKHQQEANQPPSSKGKVLHKSEPPTSNTNSKKDDTCSSEEEILVKTRKFEKRKVTSNWDRYEDTNTGKDEKESHKKGADFKQLLQNTTTSLSQFRFKDEQLWEDDADETESSSFLSINCDHLLSAVSCVPLNDRLNIKPQHFEKKQLKYLQECADMKLKAYNKENETFVVTRDNYEITEKEANNKISISTTADSSGSTSRTILDKTAIPNEEQHTNLDNVSDSHSKVTDIDKATLKEKSNDITLPKVEITSGNVNTSCHVKAEHDLSKTVEEPGDTIEQNGDELDVLLGILDDKAVSHNDKDSSSEARSFTPKINLNESDKSINTPAITSNKLSKSSEAVNLEDQLDELLNLDSNDKDEILSDNKTDTSASSKDLMKKTEESKLEDWLDSVLDD